MNLKEANLPGIGKKYSLHTKSGESLVIVVHNDGRRDLFHMDENDPSHMLSMITLDDEEARTISAIVAGLTYKPKALENQELMLDDLVIEWIPIEPLSPCIGKTIGELGIRIKTGAMIIAIMEKDKSKQINPGAEYMFTAGATLVVAGERFQLKKLKDLLLSRKDKVC